MYKQTRGIVIRATEYKESDIILTILTADSGLLTVKARSVRTNRSSYKSSCQLLSYSEFVLHEFGGFLTVKEAAVIEMFTGIRSDIEMLALASYFAQVSEAFAQEDVPSPALLSILLNCLYAIQTELKPRKLIKAVFEIKTVSLAGYEPEVTGCSVCGNTFPDRFDVKGGCLICGRCSNEVGIRMPVGKNTILALRYILYSDIKKMLSFSLDSDSIDELSNLAEAYLVSQLEQSFSTLDFYKSLIYL